MSWAQLGEAPASSAGAIADDGYEPDLILGIARGGLLVAGALSYALDVKNTFTMNVEFYTGRRRAAARADDPAAGARRSSTCTTRGC